MESHMETILEATSLEDLGAVHVTVIIPRPDGRRVAVHLNALTDEEVWQVRAGLKRISPPVKDIQRVNGKVTTLYDYDSPDYLRSVEGQNRDFAARCMIRMLTGISVPGETEDERAHNFQSRIAAYAFSYLLREATRINNIDEEQAERLADSFRAERAPAGTDTAGAQPDAGALVVAPENGKAVHDGG